MRQRNTRKRDLRRCHFLIRMWLKHAFIIIALSFVASGLAPAQDSLSGLPLDNFQFKASHNSFEKDESMDDQIDNYNCWCIELDLVYRGDCSCGIYVYHPYGGRDLCLDEAIQEILRANDLGQRVTFIWLDVTRESASDWPTNRQEFIHAAMNMLGSECIYTKSEFDSDFAANGWRWPSWQYLRDQGKKFIVVLEDTLDSSGRRADEPFFFIAVKSVSEAGDFQHATFINIEGANTDDGIPVPNDRWIYRAWFGWGTIDTHTWEDGVSRGFNLVCTDDINQGYTITDPRTHSPQPLYVNGFEFNTDHLWGTRNYPMNQIAAAIIRATPGTTLRIYPTNYPAPCTFDKPMIIERDPRYAGSVVIGGQ
jgi:hypothetical protein